MEKRTDSLKDAANTAREKQERLSDVSISDNLSVVTDVLLVENEQVQKYFVWPTNLSPKEAVTSCVDALTQHTETSNWTYQVLVIDENDVWKFIDLKEYQDFDVPFPVTDGFNGVRLNGGLEREQWPDADSPVGMSMSIYMDDGQAWLSLVVGTDQDQQARSVMESTIVAEGKSKISEVFAR